MRRITFLLFCAFVAIPLFAQLNGDGYYRIQNVTTGRYLSIVNNKVDDTNKNALMSGNNGVVYSLKTIKPFDEVASDPGSVIFIESNGSNQYTIIAQGMNTYQLTGGLTLKIVLREGSYFIYGSKSGFTLYLKDSGDLSENSGTIGLEGGQTGAVKWIITPVSTSKEYFGINADLALGDKYYTTMFCGFPYELGEGMKAYYIDRYTATGAETDAVEFIEITSGVVPAKTPVIIESNSDKASDNKVTPLADSQGPAAISNNILKGVYFSFVRRKDNGEELTNKMATQLKNVVSYDPQTMRILGIHDGKLCFTQATDLEYLPANKAYIQVPATASANMTLLDQAEFTAGINNIYVDNTVKNSGVYSLTGIRLKSDNTIDNLPNGIYIVDGKKLVKK